MPPTRLSAVERIRRARRIGATFGRVYMGLRTQRWIARRLKPSDMEARWQTFNRSSAHSIYETAVELRGLILKGCQFIGSRADVLPPEYVEILSRLQDRVPPKPFPVVRDTVESELSRELDEAFEWFSPRPIASASLAQVHEARLHGGERVAVKVQYPEIETLVKSDLANLRLLFRAVGVLERDVDLAPLVDELGTYVPRELNFVNEGRNAEEIGRFFHGRDDLYVPRVHWELTTRRVLVSEFIEGVKITDIEALGSLELDPDRVAQTLVDAWCIQILGHGRFHADPHPGNVLVQRGSQGQARVVLLDFGLAKDLPPHFRQGLVEFAGGLLRGNAETMGTALLDLGFETRDGSPESLHEIARLLLSVAVRFQDRSYLGRDVAEEAGRELSAAIRANPVVRIPSHLVLLGRVMGLLSGVSRSLGSRVDLVRTILPYAAAPRPTPSPPPPPPG